MSKAVIYVAANLIHPSALQAPGRTSPANLMSLLKSIRNDGLQYPILVARVPRGDGHYVIIDGHRRYAALIAENHEQIPCIEATGDPDHLFGAVNAATIKVSTRDWAYVWLAGGEVPVTPTRNCLIHLDKLIGENGIRDLTEKGFAPTVWKEVLNISKFIGYDTDEIRRVILAWLIKHHQQRDARAVIGSKLPTTYISDAIKEDRPIKFG